MSDRLEETELYIILADYSNDLAALKKRDGELPAQAAVKRIQSYIDTRVIEGRVDELDHIDAGAKYHYDSDNSEDVFDRQERLEAELKLKGEK